MLSEIENICDKIIFINNGQIVDIKNIEKGIRKKNIMFEVDDFSKARLLIKDYCINEELEVYETDEVISKLNKELIMNNINVYRISESSNNLERDFFKMVNNND